ncbi:MAG: Fic family protein, partial [Elusimicrobiota bacterium]|nr:Fic family protein [Elusimicrobiota bacterium]
VITTVAGVLGTLLFSNPVGWVIGGMLSIPFFVHVYYIVRAGLEKGPPVGLIEEFKTLPEGQKQLTDKFTLTKVIKGKVHINSSLMSRLPKHFQRVIYKHEQRHIKFAENHPWVSKNLPFIEEFFVSIIDIMETIKEGIKVIIATRGLNEKKAKVDSMGVDITPEKDKKFKKLSPVEVTAVATEGKIKIEEITEETIKQIHRKVCENSRKIVFLKYKDEWGKYRDLSVTVGTYKLVDGEYIFYRYSPPSYDEIPNLMKQYVEWIRENAKSKELDVFDFAASALAKLVAIHPFTDGNGQTAETIANLILENYGVKGIVYPRDERNNLMEKTQYFSAVTAAVEDNNIKPLAEFIKSKTEKAKTQSSL